MSSQTSTSFMPEKLRILSGSALKMLAMAIMLIDHTASFLLRHYPPAIAPWFQIGSTTYSLYRVMRDVGRAAFPIFCFLLVEGFLHTHNRFKYGRNLLIFACISEIPWNFAQNGTLLYPDNRSLNYEVWSQGLSRILPVSWLPSLRQCKYFHSFPVSMQMQFRGYLRKFTVRYFRDRYQISARKSLLPPASSASHADADRLTSGRSFPPPQVQ